jgi:hypothetical protein
MAKIQFYLGFFWQKFLLGILEKKILAGKKFTLQKLSFGN